MFVTVSTVGYGDFTPRTLLGRLTMCLFIVIGIYCFAQETARMMVVYQDQRRGRGSYRSAACQEHVVIIGNAGLMQLQFFFREFFHRDHIMSSNHATPDIVILIEEENNDNGTVFHQQIQDFIKQCGLHNKVFLLSGNPLDIEDLARVQIHDAIAVFVLPNQCSINPSEEDSRNILRILAVKKYIGAHTQLYAMIINSENAHRIAALGIRRSHIVCLDEIKLGLMGLSCRCPGLSTLISNLVTSRSTSLSVQKKSRPWEQEYACGAANEIYSCTLSKEFHHLNFLEAARRVHHETAGQVLLIGIVTEAGVEFNPGNSCIIKSNPKVLALTESQDKLTIYDSPISLGWSSRVSWRLLFSKTNLIHRMKTAQHRTERRVSQEARYLVHLHQWLTSPPTPTLKVLELPHIVICCNFSATESPYALARLSNFLRPLRATHVECPEPVIIVSPHETQGSWWAELSVFQEVYYVQGSPLIHRVLVKAGIDTASSIVVLAQTSQTGYDDSKAIFSAILIESAISNREKLVIIEFTDLGNNKYLDPVKVEANEGIQQRTTIYTTEPIVRDKCNEQCRATPRTRLIAKACSVLYRLRHFLRSLEKSTGRSPLDDSYELLSQMGQETFLQKRFVCGGLFPSTLAGDLLIQAYMNPWIQKFVVSVLQGNSCFALYGIPRILQRRGLRYGDLFEHMTKGLACPLPIGLLRVPTPENQAAKPYVFTAPHSKTLVHSEDRVFVIMSQRELHNCASKIQRYYRRELRRRQDVAVQNYEFM